MADNTRVNELQDKLLKAMDILNAQALNSISFDKTITCKIENDKDKKEGKYEVNDGNRIFAAYSTDTRLRVGDTVYVTVPEGNFENQKMIIGKKTADNDKPFNFTQPFDTFFDMTGNVIIPDEIKEEDKELIANSIEDKDALIENCKTSTWLVGSKDTNGDITMVDVSNKDLIKYTRLAVRADFRTWIKNAVRGEYGINIYLRTSKPDINKKVNKFGDYKYNWNNSMMYGNPYNFETYYSQEIVLDLEKQDIGQVLGIAIQFYQKANFYDKFNEPIPSSEGGFETKTMSNEYERYLDGNGYYIKQGNDLSPNIFIDNFYLSFGYDISTFTDDYVEIYTQNRDSYRRSTEVGNDYTKENQKEIKMRWVHLKDGNPVDMIAAADNQSGETEPNYEVRWYRYSVGAAAADEYCGIYWIEEKRGDFNLIFNPDVNKQQEKIKAIVLCDGIPYRSNELIFNNEEQLPPSEEAQHIASALNIVCNDGTKGNYFLYGQGCRIKDQSYANVDRVLSCYFDTNNDGEHESLIQDIKDGQENQSSITWIFPNKNTMIELIGKTEEEKKQDTIVRHIAQPKYRIPINYNSKYTNNTIQCIYELNGVVYTTEIDLTFGKAGTMGSDQTLVIDFVGDTVAYSNEDTISFQIQLFDNSGELQDIPEEAVKWEWYCNDELINNQDKIINEKGNATLTFSFDENNKWKIDKLHILQATIGTLTTYFSIPIKDGGYSHIDGPTEVIYRSDGKPDYSDLPYKLYDSGGTEVVGDNIKWNILASNGAWGYKYVGKLTSSEFSTLDKIYCTRIENYKNEDDGTKTFIDYTYMIQTQYDSTAIYYEKIIDNFIGSINNYNRLEPVSIYIKDAPVYGVIVKVDNTIVWSQPIFVCQNQYPSTVINQWDGKSLVLDEENSAVIAAAVSAGRKNSDNTFSGVMMGDWSSEGVDTDGSISGQTGLYGFHHGDMSYAFKEDGTAFIGKSSMARINFDGSNATIYSSGYNQENSAGMMIDLYGGGVKPYIKLKSANGNSIMELSTEDKGSEISMKGSNTYSGGTIRSGQISLTNKENKKPLSIIGSDTEFSVDWDGNIKANSGTIGSWCIKNNNLESNDGKVVLSTEGNGTIKINNNDIIIKGGYYDDNNERIPSQITLSSTNGVIHGGIIEAGTLRSNGGDNRRIILQGYLQVKDSSGIDTNTYLGYMESDIGDSTGKGAKGIGMRYSGGINKPKSYVKATADNAGISYDIDGDGQNTAYVTVQNEATIDSKKYTNVVGLGGNALQCGVPAQNQFGIYARFA